jgi:large repetitive protein
MATGQPVIRGQIPSGNVPDETVAQEGQGIPPTIVMPFSSVTVSDGTDPVQATVDFYGTGTVEAAAGMTAITGVPGTGSTWQSGYVSPAALTAILQGVAVQIGAIGHIGSSGVPNSRQVVALTVTDQITGHTATDDLEYEQVPIAPLVVSGGSASQTVNYGGLVHPFSGVTVTDPNATAAFQPTLAVSFTVEIGGNDNKGETLGGPGVTLQQPYDYSLSAPSAAAMTAELQNVVFTAADQAAALPNPMTISWEVDDTPEHCLPTRQPP